MSVSKILTLTNSNLTTSNELVAINALQFQPDECIIRNVVYYGQAINLVDVHTLYCITSSLSNDEIVASFTPNYQGVINNNSVATITLTPNTRMTVDKINTQKISFKIYKLDVGNSNSLITTTLTGALTITLEFIKKS